MKNIAIKLGVDKAIAYSSGARIVQAFTGVISIFFISQFLTGAEQGFYYTFGSIVAIQVFFELGLTGIITQYVAHESSHLEWYNGYRLKGDAKYLSRLASLLRFSVKWFSTISIAFFFVLLVVGFVFFEYFTPNDEYVSWQIPWVLISIGTVVNLFLQPILAILMGLDKVKEISKIRFYQQIILPVSVWLGLAVGCKLYVVGVSSLLSGAWAVLCIYRTDLIRILKNLWHVQVDERVNYMKEIFPYQWKIALSWISGYFIFQLFNPVLFATEGPVVAGQMGMTLSVLNGIQALSMSWLNTKVPLYSRLIALKDYRQLDSTFNTMLKQMSLVCLSLLIIMLIGVFGLKLFGLKLGDRFLDYGPMILMMISLFLNQFISAWATYLRCHKQEPFLMFSIVTGIACCLSTLILGKLWGLIGITGGYFMIRIISAPWAYLIYITKKNKWHYEE